VFLRRTLLLLILLALGPAAEASADPVADGRVTFELGSGFLKSLHDRGAKLRGLKPASGRDEVINVPVRGGRLAKWRDGRLLLEGRVRLATPRGAATLADLVLDTEDRTLSARLTGRRVELAAVHGLTRGRHGFAAELTLKSLTLTGAGAAAIDSSVGIPGLLRGGQAIGSATAVARFNRLTVIDGRLIFVLAEGLAEKLRTLKVNLKALGDTGLTGGPGRPIVWIPDTVGSAALDLSSGSVRSEDGFVLKQFETTSELALHGIEFDFGSKLARAGVTTRYTLPSEARATAFAAALRFPVAYNNAYTGEISSPSSPGTLTPELAARLNEVFAKPKGLPGLFEAGEPLGDLSVGLQTRRPRRG
jgi:hypothetical protein